MKPKHHPNHYIVPHAAINEWRDLHDPDNMDALCSTCPEYDTPDFLPDGGCSDTCGCPNVWVDGVMFVKLRLEGLI